MAMILEDMRGTDNLHSDPSDRNVGNLRGRESDPERFVGQSYNAQQEPNNGVSSGWFESWDVAQLAEIAKPWGLRINQIGPGKFQGNVQYVITPDVIIYQERWNRAIEATGTSPDGFFMVGTNIASPHRPVNWCGKTIDSRRWACSPSGGKVDFVTAARSNQIVLLIRSELLTRALGSEAAERLAKRNHLNFTARDGDLFAAMITRMIKNYGTRSSPLDGFETRAFQANLLEAINRCTNILGPGIDEEPMTVRRAVFRRAIEWVDQLTEPVTVLELAHQVGVCQRCLEYKFREALGITPSRYLRLYRLNRACQALYLADPKRVTVTQVAMTWGFSHPGRFSGAYRRLFGEVPSVTLARVRPFPVARLVDIFHTKCRYVREMT